MNGAHLHLMANHLPIIFPVVGIVVLLIAFLLKSEVMKRTAFLIFIIGALSTGLAMATGEEAEEVIENSINVSMNQISLHEETAETFAIISYILGGVALVSTWLNYKQSSLAKPTSLLTLILALTVLYFAKQAGTTGGEIMHPEIRSDYVTPTTNHQKEEHHNK